MKLQYLQGIFIKSFVINLYRSFKKPIFDIYFQKLTLWKFLHRTPDDFQQAMLYILCERELFTLSLPKYIYENKYCFGSQNEIQKFLIY